MIDLRLGDCLDVMGTIPDGSIDLIATDLPFGTTACRWDQIIPFEPLWAHYRHLIKPRGAIVLNASQPFTSMLVMSNREWFKYCLVWEKSRPGNPFNAMHRPMKSHEDIVVFSGAAAANGAEVRMNYNPQGLRPCNRVEKNKFKSTASIYGQRPGRANKSEYRQKWTNYPSTVLRFPNSRGGHETTKPVLLMEYLIRTYSNEGDTVLDNCMGSGTTGVACLNTGRNFIGIEKDPVYFAIAESRIAAELAKTALLDGVAS
jgi:site-specific DNA-methyltransferase (adenine-specific)